MFAPAVADTTNVYSKPAAAIGKVTLHAEPSKTHSDPLSAADREYVVASKFIIFLFKV